MSVLEISESNNEDQQLEGQLLDNEEAMESPEAAAPVTDERANVPVSETTERFLRAILAKVPLNRVEELHLFSPLRQGTVETGIAVVAARVVLPDVPDAEDDVMSELELELEAGSEVYADDDLDVDSSVDASVDAAVDAEVDATVEVSVDAEVEAEEDVVVDASVDAESDDAIDEDVVMDGALEHAAEFIAEDDDDDSPYADEPPTVRVVSRDATVAASVDEADEELDEVATVPRVRHTVYTARYRLIVKGPERGKWEIDVVDEADAPLLTVETVVRGVQRRAGEETATVRYDARQLAKALRIPASELL